MLLVDLEGQMQNGGDEVLAGLQVDLLDLDLDIQIVGVHVDHSGRELDKAAHRHRVHENDSVHPVDLNVRTLGVQRRRDPRQLKPLSH